MGDESASFAPGIELIDDRTVGVSLLNSDVGEAILRSCAKLSGVSYRAARAHFADFLKDAAQSDALGKETIKIQGAGSTAQLVRLLSERVGLGRFGKQQRLAAIGPAIKERRLTTKQHPYVRGDKGRSVRGGDHGHQLARLTCSCGAHEDISFRQLCHAEQMDRKFIQAGWRINPAKCRACQNTRENAVSSKPTSAAIKSQALMFRLLSDHFDADTGLFAAEWSDARIATETGFGTETIAAFRVEAFGALREPDEIAALARDLASLDEMMIEAARSVETIKTEMVGAKQRLADLRRRFAA